MSGPPGSGLSTASEWEKDERIKELSCLYAVAEWIEASRSVKEFFDELPKRLCPGMRYPERALVYAAYQGIEYGDKARLVKYIRTELGVARQVVGEIRVGYADAECGLLEEEQKMLDEIARMLNVALERKSLREKLALKQKEETESTERLREMERELQQADKLASLGQLVSGIGHEINNPNQFIRGNIKILQQAFEGILPILDEHYACHPDLKIARLKYDFFREHIMTLVNDMAHGSERIKGIVEGLKRFARRDEGLLIDSVDVNTILDTARRLVHNQVHKFADIELELADNLPIITGNAQKIEQVIVNLLINAGQAMPEERRGLIRASTKADSENIIIEVADNGKGMSEQTVKRIFEPFYTTRRAGGGTGLGLAIAYRIVEEHGGAISVTSRLDVGTTFRISLPVKSPGRT